MNNAVDFELSTAQELDETDCALRAYIASMDDDKVKTYRRAWDDATLITWCGDFRSDGCLMLVCCEREIDVGDFRRVLEEYILFRGFRAC